MTRFVIHNHLPKQTVGVRDSGVPQDPKKIATIYEDNSNGWYWSAPGRAKSSKLDSKAAAIAAAKTAGFPNFELDDM